MQYVIKKYNQTFSGVEFAQRFARDDGGGDLILRGEKDLHAPVRRHMRANQHDPIPPDIPPPSEEDENGAFQPGRHDRRITIFGY